MLLCLPPVGRAADAEGENTTVRGEVVDLACFLPRGEKGRGPNHQECAEMCVKGGAPLGILGSDGNVLLLVEDHDKPQPYAALKKLAGQQAEVTGKKVARGGITGLLVTAASGQ